MSNHVQCPHCGGMYKRINVHIQKMHPNAGVPVAEQENSSSAPAPLTKFFSPRSPELRIIIEPIRRGFMQTPGGSVETMYPGKDCQFRDGFFETDDKERIEYLEKKYHDPRFPVVNMTKVESNVPSKI